MTTNRPIGIGRGKVFNPPMCISSEQNQGKSTSLLASESGKIAVCLRIKMQKNGNTKKIEISRKNDQKI